MTGALFDLPAGAVVIADPGEKLSAGRRLTMRQKHDVAVGRHRRPDTRRTRPPVRELPTPDLDRDQREPALAQMLAQPGRDHARAGDGRPGLVARLHRARMGRPEAVARRRPIRAPLRRGH
jgi:hypothetical protein